MDFVWTLDGFALIPAFQTAGGSLLYYTHTARPETKSWSQLTENDFKTTASEFYWSFSGKPIWAVMKPSMGQTREAVFAKVIGLMSLTISRVFPTSMAEQQITDYYLNAR